MAVRGGLTRFARRYSAHPWASPLRGQRRRCSKTLPAFLSGQPARGLAVCPTGCASCRTPVGGSHPPAENIKKRARTCVQALISNMAVGGLTRFARPCGAARSRARGLSNWRCQLSNPSRGSLPPGGCHMRKKPVLAYELFLKYGGEGGLTRFARPCGAARSRARGLSNWRCQLSNPSRGFSTPPGGCHMRKKSPYFRTSSS